MVRTIILFALLMCSVWLPLQAQQSWPVKIGVMDHSLSIPNFWFLRYGFNPTVTVGTEYTLKQKGGHQLFLSGNLGAYHQQKVETGIFLQTDISYRYQWKQWYAGIGLGPGYAHTFFTTPEYRYGEGDFSDASKVGHSYFMLAAGLELGYQFNESPTSPRVALQFREQLYSPLSLYNGFHQLVGVSFSFFPFTNSNN
ncbi:MAG: hypothetical protein AAFV07_01390 [Bacteroidota bacterium]